MSWWTGSSSPNWPPQEGVTKLFADQVRYLREHFGLAKASFGVETGTGQWVPYGIKPHSAPRCKRNHRSWQGDYPVWVQVSRFNWTAVNDEVCFNLAIEIKDAKKTLFKNTLAIKFPGDYPRHPPRFWVGDAHYVSRMEANIMDHHIYGGGRFCIFEGEEWNADLDTIISAVNCAIELLVWHVYQYGW